MENIGVTELGYIGIGVSDMDAWREYSANVMGLEVLEEGDKDRFYLRLDYQHHRIVVHNSGSDDLDYAGWRVAGPEEFDQIKRNLEKARVDFRQADAAECEERMVLDLVKFLDPGGNPTEIYHGPRVDYHKPFHAGRRMHGRFSTGDQGLGHIILRQEDPQKAYEFYARVLGMRGSVEYHIPIPHIGITAKPIFLHSNDRDHSVAFLGGPAAKRINHLMIEVDNIDDVGYTHDIVRKRQIPVAVQLGKHSNDQMVSFYSANPSNWLFEYGALGRRATYQSEYYVSDIWGHEIEATGYGLDVKLKE
ncbi:biphenyl-2,3-diol 1,2-dioxygenase [Burkholderia multivorans]|uniref:biphenyl-2,3-diol 1,2-dioxygenase n=1 Tax=Burkholderia multivorans TaxID=87883 RepID=UPI0004AA588D|nr:biphenyl-2,3-diol 1,2-dioxygenase [Burkholderia multivorans]ALE55176.1 naphthalene 1,2-dioxygenase [Burkholderia sp. HB1]KFX63970.1 naphthalene 1,2-dioxygenase [Burkholderia sp. K24]PRF75140.1 biphenyl-2,3-diol 1,2-dioxygenase [Burkholderia multivorans]